MCCPHPTVMSKPVTKITLGVGKNLGEDVIVRGALLLSVWPGEASRKRNLSQQSEATVQNPGEESPDQERTWTEICEEQGAHEVCVGGGGEAREARQGARPDPWAWGHTGGLGLVEASRKALRIYTKGVT